MSLPPFLLTQLRSAFRSCAHKPSPTSFRPFTSTSIVLKGAASVKDSRRNERTTSTKDVSTNTKATTPTGSVGQNLVTKEDEQRRLSREFRSNVPVKVIPKAKLTPNLELSPQQRLHVEALTKRAPRSEGQKQIYKEKLLIYHFGTGREKFLILLKFVAIFSAGFVIAIVAPAHYHAGTSSWLVLLFVVGGLLPLAVIHALTKSWVTRIFLHLPPHARQTPKTAMEFARNLPANARLDIEYLRPVPLASKITANIVDLAPARQTWKMATFQWVGPRAETGTFWRPNLTQFYVQPESSRGKAARFTVPGIWSNVYKRLTGAESETISKWRK